MFKQFIVSFHFFYFFILFSMFITPSLFADSATGSEPFGEKWHKMKVNQFDLIFPEHYTNIVHDLANFLDFSTPYLFSHLDSTLKIRIPIYLHNKGSIANAFVTTYNFRSEFWHNPIFSIENSWYEALILHEGRHIAHLYHASQKPFWWKYLFWLPTSIGFTENLDIANTSFHGFFGDQQRSLFVGLIPRWFWEGEATLWESIYSDFGRGRQPSFNRNFRALVLDNKRYFYFKYHNVYFPSDKDSYLDVTHYVLGYYLVNYLYTHYDKRTVSKVLKSTGSFFYLVPTFYSELEKYTGKPLEVFHIEMVSDLKKKWEKQREAHKPFTEVKNITPFANKNTHLKYATPQVDGEGRLYSIESHSKRNHSYLVRHGENQKLEKILKLPNGFDRSFLSIGKEKAVWVNRISDIRRQDVAYGKIEMFNLKTKKRETIKTPKKTPKKNYYYASISPE